MLFENGAGYPDFTTAGARFGVRADVRRRARAGEARGGIVRTLTAGAPTFDAVRGLERAAS